MGKQVLSTGLAVLGLGLIVLSIDSWLFAGHFLHNHIQTASHTDFELLAGVLALSCAVRKTAYTDNLASVGLALIALFLIGVPAANYFNVGHLPPDLVALTARSSSMLLAGIVAAAAAYELSPRR